MVSLRDPAAQPLLDKLKDILSIAKKASRSDIPFEFPAPVAELASVVQALQKYTAEGRRDPAEFWVCVGRLNKKRRGLRLIATLDMFFKRVSYIQPGPLTKLVRSVEGSKGSEQQKQMVNSLMGYIDSNQIPPRIASYLPLLLSVASDGFHTARDRAFIGATDGPPQKEFNAYSAFLDIHWNHRKWLREHLTAVEAAYDLAVVLDHQPFIDRFKHLLFGDEFFDASRLKASRKRELAKQRQVRARLKAAMKIRTPLRVTRPPKSARK